MPDGCFQLRDPGAEGGFPDGTRQAAGGLSCLALQLRDPCAVTPDSLARALPGRNSHVVDACGLETLELTLVYPVPGCLLCAGGTHQIFRMRDSIRSKVNHLHVAIIRGTGLLGVNGALRVLAPVDRLCGNRNGGNRQPKPQDPACILHGGSLFQSVEFSIAPSRILIRIGDGQDKTRPFQYSRADAGPLLSGRHASKRLRPVGSFMTQ